MKKSLPYILVGLVVYYYWWKMQQEKELPSPPQYVPNENNQLGSYCVPKISGFPTIF